VLKQWQLDQQLDEQKASQVGMLQSRQLRYFLLESSYGMSNWMSDMFAIQRRVGPLP